MKKKARRRLFFGVLVAVILVGAGAAVYFLLPRLQPPQFLTPEKAPAVKVYFFKGERLLSVERALKADEPPLKRAILALLAGPRQDEVSRGIVSYLPPPVRLRSFRVDGQTAILDFNRELENYGGGSARLQGMIAQIIYTATEVPGIEKVWIRIEGQKDVVLGGEGLVLDRPLSRRELVQ